MQIMKQITENPTTDGQLCCFKLLLVCLLCFLPQHTHRELSSFLASYVHSQSPTHGRLFRAVATVQDVATLCALQFIRFQHWCVCVEVVCGSYECLLCNLLSL